MNQNNSQERLLYRTATLEGRLAPLTGPHGGATIHPGSMHDQYLGPCYFPASPWPSPDHTLALIPSPLPPPHTYRQVKMFQPCCPMCEKVAEATAHPTSLPYFPPTHQQAEIIQPRYPAYKKVAETAAPLPPPPSPPTHQQVQVFQPRCPACEKVAEAATLHDQDRQALQLRCPHLVAQLHTKGQAIDA